MIDCVIVPVRIRQWDNNQTDVSGQIRQISWILERSWIAQQIETRVYRAPMRRIHATEYNHMANWSGRLVVCFGGNGNKGYCLLELNLIVVVGRFRISIDVVKGQNKIIYFAETAKRIYQVEVIRLAFCLSDICQILSEILSCQHNQLLRHRATYRPNHLKISLNWLVVQMKSTLAIEYGEID